MNARYILAAALLVVSTAAYAEGSKTEHHHTNDNAVHRHTGRDDLETSCTSLAMQYEDNTALPHTAAADKLHNEGVEWCRAGSREVGVEKLKEALQTIGATPELD
jgi:hypothetical protein